MSDDSVAASASEEYRPRGRPRDPHVDQRILDAALELFAQRGWTGMTMDGVAQCAHTGKTSLYTRWPSRHDLLAAAFRSYLDEFTLDVEEPASVRDQLIAEARMRTESLVGRHGLALLRFDVEARIHPDEVGPIYREVTSPAVLSKRRWLQAAIDAGDVHTTRSAMQILEAIEGSAMVHVLVTPPELVPRMRQELPRWVVSLVDSQLS